jgi:hypothetical protein
MAQKTEVFKVMVAVGSAIQKCDGIAWKGKLWLVPFWLDTIGTKETTPGRVIRFDNLPHQDQRGSNLGAYILSTPVPKELFEAQPLKTPIADFECIELPALARREDERPH